MNDEAKAGAVGEVPARARAGREVFLDTLRGLLLVLMLLEHAPGPLHAWTLHWFGFLSEAEGFVFLSGCVAGWVYTRTLRERGVGALWRRAGRRAVTIYVWHLAAFVAVWGLLHYLDPHVARLGWGAWEPILGADWPAAAGWGLALFYQPTMMDILPMYFVLLLFLPALLMVAEEKGGGWVLLGSLVLWLAAQAGCRASLADYLPDGRGTFPGNFDVWAWQLLFVAGVVVGHRFAASAGPPRKRRTWVLGPALFVLGGLFAVRHSDWGGGVAVELPEALISKPHLGPMRLLNFLALAGLVYAGYPVLRTRCGNRALALLGRQSLVVFAFHLPLIFSLHLAQRYGWLPGPARQCGVVALAAATLWLPAWGAELGGRWRRRGAG